MKSAMKSGKRADDPKVRLYPHIYAAVTEIVENTPPVEGLTQVSIVNEAVEAWLNARAGCKPKAEAPDPAITPQSEHEYRVISGLLAILREEAKHDPPSRGKRKGAA